MDYSIQIRNRKVVISHPTSKRTWEWAIPASTANEQRFAALCLEMVVNGFVGPAPGHFQYGVEARKILEKQGQKYQTFDAKDLFPHRPWWKRILWWR